MSHVQQGFSVGQAQILPVVSDKKQKKSVLLSIENEISGFYSKHGIRLFACVNLV